MLNRFSEMIKQGVAKHEYVNTFNDTPNRDFVSRIYNNIWGAISDTCMTIHYENDKPYWVITGSMISHTPEKFEEFLNASRWGTCEFFRVANSVNLQEYFEHCGIKGDYGIQNGDKVYILHLEQPKEQE